MPVMWMRDYTEYVPRNFGIERQEVRKKSMRRVQWAIIGGMAFAFAFGMATWALIIWTIAKLF